ncbi:MAG: YcxB family protein [Ruminococcus sp.]|uniref:YcxB family protein n=1 Tax=Ruminococcus sp. TaxID=41978 RepID=UPI0025D1359B|nr:YcxB family protein [Ruminococcus sp.]MBO4865068.1 YcxB family protein [Ruminococcus sp.]
MEIDISKNGGNTEETEEKLYERDNPDNKAEEEAKPEEEKEFVPTGAPLTGFDYNVKNEEEEEAFTIFQQKYVYKRNFMISALFAIVAVMFAVSIAKNPQGYINWVLCFVCLVMIFTTWFNTFRIKKYLMKALSSLEDDQYRFTLYDDCFKIETVFTEEEMQAEDFTPVKPRIVRFEDISLNIIENERLFIIILRKETIYVLSKRVIDEADQKLLRDKLKEVLGEDYEIKEK